MNAKLNLNDPIHFTLYSGLVEDLVYSFWNPPQERHGSTICVFDARYGRLLYQIEPGAPRPSRVNYKLFFDLVNESKIRVLAVNRLPRTFSFQTDFIFDDIEIPHVVITTTLSLKESAVDIATAIIQNEDPLRNLCCRIKSRLDSTYRQVRFENIKQLDQFVDEFELTGRQIKEQNKYLSLEVLDVGYNIGKFKKLGIEKINTKKVVNSRLELLRKYRDKTMSEHSEVKDLYEIIARIPQILWEIRGLEEYVYEMISDFIIETIRKYNDKILNEHSKIMDIQEIIRLIFPLPIPEPYAEQLILVIERLIKPVMPAEDQGGKSLSSSPTASDDTTAQKSEKGETAQTKTKRRWQGSKKSDDTASAHETKRHP